MKRNKLIKLFMLSACLFMTSACFNSSKPNDDVNNDQVDQNEQNNSQTITGNNNSNGNENTNIDQNKDYLFDLGDGLVITEIKEYDGKFVEDGTDEKVKDVLAIVVKNTSGSTLQYCEITVSGGNGVANFALTTLGPNESVLVLESNRQEYISKKDTYLNASVKNVAFFREDISMHSNVLSIQGLDGAFNVTNKSSELIEGPIYIYYKNVEEDYYLGGITYRCKVENIKAGELKQVMTNHYDKDNCEVVFVTIGQ